MYRLLAVVLIMLLVAYYFSVILYGAEMIKLSNKQFSFGKAIIPFYYWIF